MVPTLATAPPRVTDAGVPPLMGITIVQVTVSVANVNDIPPVLSSTPAQINIVFTCMQVKLW